MPLDPRKESVYSYANNNPLKYIDPDGRKIKLVFKDAEDREHVNHKKAKFFYKKAKKYLSKSPYAAALFKRLEEHEGTVTIVIEKHTQSTDYDWTNGKKITWDPFAGYEIEEGKVQSAAIGLLHEVGQVHGPGVESLVPGRIGSGHRLRQTSPKLLRQ